VAHGLWITARHRVATLIPARRGAIAGLLGLAAILPLAFFDGGYFPTSWGVPALVGLWIATVAIGVAPASLHRREMVALAALTVFLCWSALSLIWTIDRPQTVLELERLTIYVATLAALLFVARRESVPWLLGGLTAGIGVICGVGLTRRLFRDVFGAPDPRIHDASALYEPVGYSNAVGDLAAVGVLLCVGFMVHSRRPAARAIAAATCVVLLAALALSLSRGAWLALGVGIVAAVALAPRRAAFVGWLLAFAVPGVAIVVLSFRADALLTRDATEAAAVAAGHRLAAALGLLALVAAILAVLGPRLVPRRRVAASPRRVALGLGLLAALVLALGTIRVGGPAEIATRAGDAFRDPPRGTEPSERFFSLSGGRRDRYWRVAWEDFESRPLTGSGSGTFGRYWLEHRPVARFVRDAHSLYLETLAEVGVVGFVLLAVALAMPLAAAVSARGEPLVPATLGAYVVFLVHSGADWLWEMPVTTMAALVCGAGLLLAARPAVSGLPPRSIRAGAVGLALALGALSFVGLIGNSAAASAEEALFTGDLRRAETHARRATTWTPWAADPWLLLARAQLGRGDRNAARESLDRALARDPDNWLLWYERGLASTGSERRRSFAEASRLNPRDMRRLLTSRN
jgi:O-antigen ligase